MIKIQCDPDKDEYRLVDSDTGTEGEICPIGEPAFLVVGKKLYFSVDAGVVKQCMNAVQVQSEKEEVQFADEGEDDDVSDTDAELDDVEEFEDEEGEEGDDEDEGDVEEEEEEIEDEEEE